MHSWKRSEKKNFCACFYSLSEEGNPDGTGSVLEEEKERDDGLTL